MKGIGAGVGALLGLAVVTWQQFNIWPFNKKRKASNIPEGRDRESESDVREEARRTQKHRRSHPRSWTPTKDVIT